MHQFLVHKRGDQVAVATQNVKSGEVATAVYMDDQSTIELSVREDIPLGHKIALVDALKNSEVIEYGQVIGLTTKDWVKGDYVHTHNIKSKRW